MRSPRLRVKETFPSTESLPHATSPNLRQNSNCNGGSDLLVRLFLAITLSTWAFAAGPLVDFNPDVRPILSDNCFACHGPHDKRRMPNLRLDTEEGLFADPGAYRIAPPRPPPTTPLLPPLTAPPPPPPL